MDYVCGDHQCSFPPQNVEPLLPYHCTDQPCNVGGVRSPQISDHGGGEDREPSEGFPPHLQGAGNKAEGKLAGLGLTLTLLTHAAPSQTQRTLSCPLQT